MTVGVGMSAGLLEVAVTVSVWASLLAPEEMLERLTVWGPAFSLRLTLAKVSSVGASLTGFTVTVKERETILLLAAPSLTVTVTVAEPEAEAAGVNVRDPVALGLV